MTDQTTPTPQPDHVAVTDAVVAKIAEYPAIGWSHPDGRQSGIPRYVADAIGQAAIAAATPAEKPDYLLGVSLGDALRDIARTSAGPVDGWDLDKLADRADTYQAMVAGLEDEPAEPVELTPVQYALLDALRDVATTADAPAAVYAGKEIGRLAAEALGYPLPAPVEREGGVMGFLYGRPVAPKVEVHPAGVAPVDSLRRQVRAMGGVVDPSVFRLVGEQGPAAVPTPRITDAEPGDALHEPTAADLWPFKPGDVVRDSGEEADHGAWIDAAPDGVVLKDHAGDHWKRDESGWWCTLNEPTTVGRLTSHDLESSWGPLTVVSVPDQEANRG